MSEFDEFVGTFTVPFEQELFGEREAVEYTPPGGGDKRKYAAIVGPLRVDSELTTAGSSERYEDIEKCTLNVFCEPGVIAIDMPIRVFRYEFANSSAAEAQQFYVRSIISIQSTMTICEVWRAMLTKVQRQRTEQGAR